MEYTRYARVSHSRQWCYYNVAYETSKPVLTSVTSAVADWKVTQPHVRSLAQRCCNGINLYLGRETQKGFDRDIIASSE